MEHKAISRKRKKEEVGIDGANKKHRSDNGGIDKLPNDVLINIVSRMSFKEAVRASVLARRWRCLWKFYHGTMRFDVRDISPRNLMGIEKFKSCANTVMELHQGRDVEGVVVHLEGIVNGGLFQPMSRALDELVYFATHKEVQTLEVKLSLKFLNYRRYELPHVGWLKSPLPYSSLRALRLTHVDVTDEQVCYLLASCHSLEELCIRSANKLNNLRVVG
ncbi:F-box/FBD/LRR-repeat protein At3g26920-like, partial [Salvia miltiorrhiza]|uniref:F-box/FBD/LRR-repeat protein At3g26920-like n=1 Tax=Salvia miltiorrhiza TaxID=226208 RepID=UPI0025ACB2D7